MKIAEERSGSVSKDVWATQCMHTKKTDEYMKPEPANGVTCVNRCSFPKTRLW
jgi:hypothetical protein